MNKKISLSSLIVANILTSVSLLIFATGFFPYKPIISGHARFSYNDYGVENVSRPFDKVIFMVIDALRRYDAKL